MLINFIFFMPATGNVSDLKYHPNTKLNLGLGVTYKNYTLNVAYGFGFLNKNYNEKGKTKGLDLHFHLFPNKIEPADFFCHSFCTNAALYENF